MNHLAQQLPALIVVAPLLSAFVATLLSWRGRNAGFHTAAIALAISLACSLGVVFQVASDGPILYRMAGWDPPIGISYYVDGLNALVLAILSFTALVNLIGSRPSVSTEYAGKEGSFYTLYLLAVTGHLGMVITGDAFNLYVLLEIAALTGYALLGLGRSSRSAHATLNYLFIGTIGASFYLLGVGFLYIQTGTLNINDLSGFVAQLGATPTVLAALGLIVAGVLIKMAFFPVHSWLPNAYGNAGGAAAGLIAPMTTKVMVYVMLRMMLTVFQPELVYDQALMDDVLVALASVGIVVCGFMALRSRNLTRILTFILLAEVGYMVGGAWLGNRMGVTGATLHVINDAAMTLTMFMAATAIRYKVGKLDFANLEGLFSKMPFTMGAFAIGAVAMIGVPPTCGFFSKWYLILGGLEAGHYEFVAALVLSSLMNVILFFRIFEIAYFLPWPPEPAHGDGGHHGHGAPRPAIAMAEAPVSMVAPLLLSAAALVALGFVTNDLVTFIETALPASLR